MQILFYFKESCTFAQVNNKRLRVKILLFLLVLFSSFAGAQNNGSNPVIRNAISLNVGQLIINEFNLGYEHLFSEKKSIELNGGLIYRNELWRNEAKDWTNSQYFHETGFTSRIIFKIYRKGGINTGKRNYYSIGLNYQYLYFNNEWFETDKDIKVKLEPSGDEIVTKEDILRHRFRNRIGLQLDMGNILPLGKSFSFEFYYGLGVRGVFSNRFDVARGAKVEDQQLLLSTLNFEDQKFYIRPAIHAGLKLRAGW